MCFEQPSADSMIIALKIKPSMQPWAQFLDLVFLDIMFK